EISSGSMAEALHGAHRDVRCGDCGFAFAVGSSREDQLPSFAPRAICPNCGAASALDHLPDQHGDRIVANRGAYILRSPRRWDLVLFRDPEETDRVAAKRVVGLPGETVRIRDGNVWINGRPARKSLDQQRAMAILVHDAAHRARSLANRWQPADSN